MKLIAKIFSIVFQPILMPILCMVLIFNFNNTIGSTHNTTSELTIYSLCIAFTIIFPIIIFAIFYKMGWVTDVNLTVRKERTIPFFLSIALFVVFYYLVRINPTYNKLLSPIIFGTLLVTFIANSITMFWKISIHSLGVSTVLGTFVGLAMVTHNDHTILITFFSAVVLIIGISRVLLKRHTTAQVVAGTSLGFLGTVLTIIYDIYI